MLQELEQTLTFATGENAHVPNYESQKEYLITIVAEDSNMDTGATNRVPLVTKLDVKITVTNLEEEGEVSLSQEKLQRGVSVTAMLSDPDKDENRVRWQWRRLALPEW